MKTFIHLKTAQHPIHLWLNSADQLTVKQFNDYCEKYNIQSEKDKFDVCLLVKCRNSGVTVLDALLRLMHQEIGAYDSKSKTLHLVKIESTLSNDLQALYLRAIQRLSSPDFADFTCTPQTDLLHYAATIKYNDRLTPLIEYFKHKKLKPDSLFNIISAPLKTNIATSFLGFGKKSNIVDKKKRKVLHIAARFNLDACTNALLALESFITAKMLENLLTQVDAQGKNIFHHIQQCPRSTAASETLNALWSLAERILGDKLINALFLKSRDGKIAFHHLISHSAIEKSLFEKYVHLCLQNNNLPLIDNKFLLSLSRNNKFSEIEALCIILGNEKLILNKVINDFISTLFRCDLARSAGQLDAFIDLCFILKNKLSGESFYNLFLDENLEFSVFKTQIEIAPKEVTDVMTALLHNGLLSKEQFINLLAITPTQCEFDMNIWNYSNNPVAIASTKFSHFMLHELDIDFNTVFGYVMHRPELNNLDYRIMNHFTRWAIYTELYDYFVRKNHEIISFENIILDLCNFIIDASHQNNPALAGLPIHNIDVYLDEICLSSALFTLYPAYFFENLPLKKTLENVVSFLIDYPNTQSHSHNYREFSRKMDLVPFLYYVFVENQAIGDVFLQHHAINIFLKNIIIASRDFHNLDKKISSDIFKIIETENNNERLMNHLAAFISTNFAKPNTPSTLVKSATDDKPIPTTTTSATTTTASFFNPAAPAPLDEKEDVQRLAL